MEALRSLPRNLRILIALFVAVLVARFFWSFMVYPVPLGYDTGIYRTLFLLHAEGWPPFATAALPGWAKAHDIGLFILSTPLLRLGIPVDWLIGWIWNAFPVFLACVLAWVTVKREGAAVGAVVLLLCALSLPYYDGFWVMYYKVYVSLLWMVLTLHFLDRGSWWAVVPGLLTLVTHRQTGLLLTLVVLVWWAICGVRNWRSPAWRYATAAGIVLFLLAVFVYLPSWKFTVSDVLHKLTTLGDSESGGGFEEPSFYLAGGFVLLVLGAVGLAWRKPFTIWHIVPILSAIFVLIQFFFYRRFFLYFEFFLLPFAAWSVVWIWQQRNTVWRVLLLAFVAAQGYGAVRQMVLLRPPSIDQQTFALIEEASKTVEDGATVVALENLSAPWLLGWMPEQTVAGPGMFNVKWNEDDWGKLLLGTQTEKEQVLRKSSKDGNLYLFAGPYFFEHYGTVADSFLKNSCFNRVGKTALYKVTCR